MRRTWRVAALAALLAATSGCRRTYSTRAEYEAPVAGYRATVTASGSFSTDYDLNPVPTGRAVLEPLTAGAHPTVTLDVPGNETVKFAIRGGAAGVAPWGGPHTLPTLNAILAAAGYPPGPADEAEKMARVIEGVTFGPKGTVTPGQPGGPIRIGKVSIR